MLNKLQLYISIICGDCVGFKVYILKTHFKIKDIWGDNICKYKLRVEML